jgi:protein TonB
MPRSGGEGRTRWGAISAGLHVLLVVALAGGFRHEVATAPYKLPGTAQGVRLLTYYSPGTAPHAVNTVAKKEVVEKPSVLSTKAALTAPPTQSGAPAAETGTGSSAESGKGEGEIRIAVQTYFPYPKISPSVLPRGTNSDVILNAVIDPAGKIAELTVVKGMGPGIDDVVMATVKAWTFTPATRNGVAISSEQELHFHYERS